MNSNKTILSKIFAREKTLFYFSMWNDSDRLGWEDFLGYTIQNNLFIIKPKGKKSSVWYSLDELAYMEQQAEMALAEPDFMTKIQRRFEYEWPFLVAYLNGNQKIETCDDLLDYYQHLTTWWSAMVPIFELPNKENINDDVRKLIIQYRQQSEKYTERMNELFIEFWEKKFPQYQDILFFVQPHEAAHIAKGEVNESYIAEIRKRVNGCYLFNGNIILEDTIDDVLQQHNLVLEQQEVKETHQLLGTATYHTHETVTGIVRVIKNLTQISQFKSGEILVTEMTNPNCVPIMKKATAIITDEGGLMCHAAIVSREIKVPCIIGTRNATQVLRDGDLVEIDADNGVVRKVQ
ncbi:hypothetical protein KC866_00400 [Patescibacteria group bacterium]|nr:hypothetical protein [Patescibacteria group bacterium]